MAKKQISELKEYFKVGKRPTESQFEDVLDSFIHKDVVDLVYGETQTNTLSRDDAGAAGVGVRSGFYQTPNPINFPQGASSWWHLLDVRHSNVNNNYAMQIAGSFFDQDLWYRKTSNDSTQKWRKIISAEPNGNVGIGTSSPQAPLHLQFDGESKSIQFLQFSNNLDSMNSAVRYTWHDAFCDVGIVRGGSANIIGYVIKFDGTETARFAATGNAAFQGKIEAKDFVVSTSPTADFVFDANYNLKTISDLESFVTKNKHLPEIPSAKEIEKNGLAVGDFQIKLLQKIEELTLYIIAQNKEIENLKRNLN